MCQSCRQLQAAVALHSTTAAWHHSTRSWEKFFPTDQLLKSSREHLGSCSKGSPKGTKLSTQCEPSSDHQLEWLTEWNICRLLSVFSEFGNSTLIKTLHHSANLAGEPRTPATWHRSHDFSLAHVGIRQKPVEILQLDLLELAWLSYVHNMSSWLNLCGRWPTVHHGCKSYTAALADT